MTLEDIFTSKITFTKSDSEMITSVAPSSATITISYTKDGNTKTNTEEITIKGELPYWN